MIPVCNLKLVNIVYKYKSF